MANFISPFFAVQQEANLALSLRRQEIFIQRGGFAKLTFILRQRDNLTKLPR